MVKEASNLRWDLRWAEKLKRLLDQAGQIGMQSSLSECRFKRNGHDKDTFKTTPTP